MRRPNAGGYRVNREGVCRCFSKIDGATIGNDATESMTFCFGAK